jgi:hypothetical protein
MKFQYSIIESGIAQWYSGRLRAGRSGVRFLAGDENCFPHHRVQAGSGARPVSYPMSTWVSFPGREADRSPPSSAEVNNAWNYTFTPSIRLNGAALS